jgi:hypothetical protein
MTADAYPASLGCADAARARGASIAASAGRHDRFLLVEMPGPWGSSVAEATYPGTDVARELVRAAADAHTHVVLIRRPGRPADTGPAGTGPAGTGPAGTGPAGTGPADRGPDGSLAWAIADTRGSGRLTWGSWREPGELLGIDLGADHGAWAQSGGTAAGSSGPQRVALICTNGKRDRCCAVYGRPAAAAVAAAATDWDTWECSHLGGHRYAATMLLLPAGDMFGWLDPESAVAAIRGFDSGELALPHYRGRTGQPPQAQAALHAAAIRLDEPRRDALRVCALRAGEADRWTADVVHTTPDGTQTRYLVTVAGAPSQPGLLSCADEFPRAETEYETVSFARIQGSGSLRRGRTLRSAATSWLCRHILALPSHPGSAVTTWLCRHILALLPHPARPSRPGGRHCPANSGPMGHRTARSSPAGHRARIARPGRPRISGTRAAYTSIITAISGGGRRWRRGGRRGGRLGAPPR